MTLTIGTNCSEFNITSTYLSTNNQSVTLNVTMNCETEWELPVEVEVTTIVVSPEDLEMLNVISDGVYNIKLTIIQQDGTQIIESVCKFVNCVSNCLMLDSFLAAANGDEAAILRVLAYHALVASDGCTSCACADLCELYKLSQLEDCVTTTTVDVSGCGCS